MYIKTGPSNVRTRKAPARDVIPLGQADDLAVVSQYFSELSSTLDALSHDEIVNVAQLLRRTRTRGRTIYTMGNGGSGATASHMAGDLNKGASHGQQQRYKAVCLNDNFATFASYANDLDYSEVFVEQLKNFLVPGDLVIGISGSGNSPNVVKAIEYARAHGGQTLAMTGFDGGRVKVCAEHCFHVPLADMQICEDLHMVLVHVVLKMLCAAAEKQGGASQPTSRLSF